MQNAMTSNMALTLQNIFTRLLPQETAPKIPNSSFLITSKPFANSLPLRSIRRQFPSHAISEPFRSRVSIPRVFESEGFPHADEPRMRNQKLEVFLLISEILCLTSSAVLSMGLVIKWAILGWKTGFQGLLVNGVVALQAVTLTFSVAIAAWARQWQWRRISRSSSEAGSSEVNLVERIENLEDEMRKSSKIVRVLSRQLEKLGIRFRVTRKALNVPIAETADLARKNSETTGVLAVKEGILEKELSEIQKALIAMQEQQQKQLELIVAICRNGKLLGSKAGGAEEKQKPVKFDPAANGVKEMELFRTPSVVAISKRL